MEQVEGKTLREVLFSGALPLNRLPAIAAQIADGLATAHEAAIVHRDLKPENVMMMPSGLMKILDFGLAKRTSPDSASDEASHLTTETGTSPGIVVGTVGYMSPEQAAGQPPDFHSDQFAFGSILYEMATGKRAFQKRTAVETLSAILNEKPKPVAEINPHAPPPLRWIVERCHAKESERRYASTNDLASDLATLQDHISELTPGRTIEVEEALQRRVTGSAGIRLKSSAVDPFLLKKTKPLRSCGLATSRGQGELTGRKREGKWMNRGGSWRASETWNRASKLALSPFGVIFFRNELIRARRRR